MNVPGPTSISDPEATSPWQRTLAQTSAQAALPKDYTSEKLWSCSCLRLDVLRKLLEVLGYERVLFVPLQGFVRVPSASELDF